MKSTTDIKPVSSSLKAEIVLDNAQRRPFYTTNDTIQGRVFLTSSRNENSVSQIQMSLIGSAFIQKHEYSKPFVKDFLKMNDTIFSANSATQGILKTCEQYGFPFSFKIPPRILENDFSSRSQSVLTKSSLDRKDENVYSFEDHCCRLLPTFNDRSVSDLDFFFCPEAAVMYRLRVIVKGYMINSSNSDELKNLAFAKFPLKIFPSNTLGFPLPAWHESNLRIPSSIPTPTSSPPDYTKSQKSSSSPLSLPSSEWRIISAASDQTSDILINGILTACISKMERPIVFTTQKETFIIPLILAYSPSDLGPSPPFLPIVSSLDIYLHAYTFYSIDLMHSIPTVSSKHSHIHQRTLLSKLDIGSSPENWVKNENNTYYQKVLCPIETPNFANRLTPDFASYHICRKYEIEIRLHLKTIDCKSTGKKKDNESKSIEKEAKSKLSKIYKKIVPSQSREKYNESENEMNKYRNRDSEQRKDQEENQKKDQYEEQDEDEEQALKCKPKRSKMNIYLPVSVVTKKAYEAGKNCDDEDVCIMSVGEYLPFDGFNKTSMIAETPSISRNNSSALSNTSKTISDNSNSSSIPTISTCTRTSSSSSIESSMSRLHISSSSSSSSLLVNENIQSTSNTSVGNVNSNPNSNVSAGTSRVQTETLRGNNNNLNSHFEIEEKPPAYQE